MTRPVERLMLKMRGVDPDELELELRMMDEAKKRREKALEAAKARAHARERHGDDVAFDVMGED